MGCGKVEQKVRIALGRPWEVQGESRPGSVNCKGESSGTEESYQ